MSEPRFDEEIHTPARLRVCAYLASLSEAEFGAVRDDVGLSDSALSKHVARLEDAGYVGQRRRAAEGRSRVWLHLTPQGRAALAGHLAALQALATQAGLGEVPR